MGSGGGQGGRQKIGALKYVTLSPTPVAESRFNKAHNCYTSIKQVLKMAFMSSRARREAHTPKTTSRMKKYSYATYGSYFFL